MPNPFAHIELSTDDVKKAKKFYQSVFAWKLSEMPGMAYTMIDVGEGKGAGGGMQKKQMPEAPTAWLPYVQVDDLKGTMAKAIKLGAKPALEYQEIGAMGAIGIFIDPAGAALGLWQNATPAAEPPPEKPAEDSAPAKGAPAKSAPAKSAPAKSAPAKSAPAKSAPAKSAPAKSAPAKGAPSKSAPAKSAPAKSAPAKSAPAKSAPAKSAPAKKGAQESSKGTPPPSPAKKSAPKKR